MRAQYTLATLYTTGRGVLKDPQRATHWLAQAAARGHAHALNELAARHLDGHGVPQDVQKALDHYRRAAAKGIAQAAFSLGYLHETGRADQKRDKDSAAQWYYQAGVLSLKDRDLKGAQSALQALNALQADHPLSRKLLEAEPGLAGGELRGHRLGQQWRDLQRRRNGLPRFQPRGRGQDRGVGEAGEVGGGVRESCPFRRR